MKKIFLSFVAALFVVSIFSVNVVQGLSCDISTGAPQFSILPTTKKTFDECKTFMVQVEALESDEVAFTMKTCRDDVLACGVQTGRIGFWMIPYYISFVTNFLLGLSGLICVLFIVIGGYRYVMGGLTEDKEKGKQTIMHALMGLGVALLAWTIVTVLIRAVTG